MRVWVLPPLATLSALLLVAGCASQQDTYHPIDAADSFMRAVAEGDQERMCALFANPGRGPLPEESYPECEWWTGQVVRDLSEHDRRAFGEARIVSVTLVDSDAAQVLAEDFENPPPRLSSLDLIEWNGRWYVEDMNFDD